MGLKRESRFCVGNVGSGHFAHHFRSVGIEHREEAGTGIQSQLHSRRSDDIESVLLRQSEVVYTPPRIVHKDLCRGLCLWVVGFSALVISKQTEDIVAVEVDREHLAVLIAHFKCRVVQLADRADGSHCLADGNHAGRNGSHGRNACHEWQG